MRNGWDVKKLSEVCQIKPPKSEVKIKLRDSSVVSFLPMEDLGVMEREVVAKKERKLSEVVGSYTYFADDDVLLAKITPCFENGKVGIARNLKNGIGFGSSEYVVFRSQGAVIPEYLFYFVSREQFRDEGSKVMMGAVGHKRVSKEFIENYPIPFPISISEQSRIVSILDTTFAAIAKAKANAEKNLRNAKELFESYLQGVFANPGEDWEGRKVKELAKVTGGYSFKSDDFKKSGKYQVLRMGNIRPGIIREEESPVFVDKIDANVIGRASLRINDVIITQTGTKKKRDYGFTVIVNKDNYLLNQRIASIRFSENYLPRFFLYYSWTNLFKDQFFENETGTVGQGNVGIGAITDALIPFCAIEEQRRIVDIVDSLAEKTNELNLIYSQKLNDLEELKKSILQRAFNGELKTTVKELA